MKMPKGLVEETKAIIGLYLFLRHECGMKEADKLGAREMGDLLRCVKAKKKVKL